MRTTKRFLAALLCLLLCIPTLAGASNYGNHDAQLAFIKDITGSDADFSMGFPAAAHQVTGMTNPQVREFLNAQDEPAARPSWNFDLLLFSDYGDQMWHVLYMLGYRVPYNSLGALLEQRIRDLLWGNRPPSF